MGTKTVTAAPPPAPSPEPAGGDGRLRGLLTAGAFLAPAFVLLAVWILYPTVWTVIRSFYDRAGDAFVGFDNYTEIFTNDALLKSVTNNLIWVAVVPALVTALGLIFAVLTERVSWATAFKLLVFMPIAISFFAAGISWRIMLDISPERGAVNAAIGTVYDAVEPPGPLTGAEPSGRALEASGGAIVLGTRSSPDRRRASASPASPPARCPRTPGRRCGRSRSPAASRAWSGATSGRGEAGPGSSSPTRSACRA